MEKFASGQPAENFARQRGNFSHFQLVKLYKSSLGWQAGEILI